MPGKYCNSLAHPVFILLAWQNPSLVSASAHLVCRHSLCSWRERPTTANRCHLHSGPRTSGAPQCHPTRFCRQRPSPSPRKPFLTPALPPPTDFPPTHTRELTSAPCSPGHGATRRELRHAPIALPTLHVGSCTPPALLLFCRPVVHMPTQVSLCPLSPTQGLHLALVPSPLPPV